MQQKINKRFARIRSAIPTLLLLAVLAAAFLGTVISWNFIVEETKAEQAREVEHQALALYDEIGRQLAILDGYSASFTRENIESHSSLMEKLERCVENTEYSYVCFARPDGTLYRNDSVMVHVSHRYYFRQTMQGERVVEFLVNSFIDDTSRVGMAVPVILNGETVGVLLGLHDRADFQTLFERSFSEITTFTYLCDSEGNLIMGTENAERFLAEAGFGSAEGSNYMDILEGSLFTAGSKEQVEEHMRAGMSGQVEYSYKGDKRYATYLPLGVNDWYIVSVLHESLIYEDAIGVTGIFYGIIFLTMVAVLFIIVYILRRERKRALLEKEKFDHDALTGALAEKAFLERLRERLPEMQPGEYCLVYLDIYKFKLINEIFGYAKGNELLCALADELQKLTQACGGLCGRISGDCFVLLLPHREELIREFNTKKYRKERIIPMDLYLHYGIYVIRNTEIPADRMVDAAKLAQKMVKGNYDNCVCYYDDRIKQRLLKEQEIVSAMASALEKGEFVLYLQPQYNYRNKAISGAEVLVRWNSPANGLIPPGEFIPVFETNGFIMRLDEYIWEQACRLQRRWLDEGRHIVPVSVNVSRADLLKGDIAKKMTDLVEKYGLTADLLRIEITESAYMDNPQQMISEITQLAECGFTVEMDDFGSGYSSLNMLKDVPFHVLKTDLKFLSATGNESRRVHILDSVIRMAHGMGMTVVAEGVETQEQADYLLGLNCEQMQGYYFSRPVPVEQYEQLLPRQ